MMMMKEKADGFKPFLRVLVWNKTIFFPRIWTRVADLISYEDKYWEKDVEEKYVDKKDKLELYWEALILCDSTVVHSKHKELDNWIKDNVYTKVIVSG